MPKQAQASSPNKMPFLPPTNFSAPRIHLKRAVRRLLWPHPSIYYPFGVLRNRGNVFRKNAQLFMGGYPRSGNTFAQVAFATANPGVRIRSHQHIPTYVLHLTKSQMPGLVVIRPPLDASVSWAIHENQTLEEAVSYWNDYYEMLLPVRSQLFVARFKDVTTDFGAVIKAFNTRWGTNYTPFIHTAETAARCFKVTEDDNRAPGGEIREMRVCRPSRERQIVKETHLDHLNQSNLLRKELARANELYEEFVNHRAECEMPVSSRVVSEEVENEEIGVGAAVLSIS